MKQPTTYHNQHPSHGSEAQSPWPQTTLRAQSVPGGQCLHELNAGLAVRLQPIYTCADFEPGLIETYFAGPVLQRHQSRR